MTLGGSCYFYTHFGEANLILMFFYITKDDTTELMVILNSFNVVQFAHALHSSSKLALLSLNRKFQDLSAEKDKKRLAVRC